MATGAGKTYTAVTAAYRLLPYGGFQRILFLVDRNNLADQTLAEFQNYRTPGDGRRFTEIYRVDKLTSAGMLGSCSVVISTIQRVFKALQGEQVTDVDDPGLDDFVPDAPVTVAYDPAMPPESFDLVIVDEAHRSIYGVWRGVLEYFDAHVVGLTATPGKQTFAFFRQNLVSEYTYPQSVADLVNVDFDLYRIRTEISEKGGTIDAGLFVPKVDRRTRKDGSSSSRRTTSTPTSSSTVPSPPSPRSASSSRRSGTGCSPRSSPADPPSPRPEGRGLIRQGHQVAHRGNAWHATGSDSQPQGFAVLSRQDHRPRRPAARCLACSTSPSSRTRAMMMARTSRHASRSPAMALSQRATCSASRRAISSCWWSSTASLRSRASAWWTMWWTVPRFA